MDLKATITNGHLNMSNLLRTIKEGTTGVKTDVLKVFDNLLRLFPRPFASFCLRNIKKQSENPSSPLLFASLDTYKTYIHDLHEHLASIPQGYEDLKHHVKTSLDFLSQKPKSVSMFQICVDLNQFKIPTSCDFSTWKTKDYDQALVCEKMNHFDISTVSRTGRFFLRIVVRFVKSLMNSKTKTSQNEEIDKIMKILVAMDQRSECQRITDLLTNNKYYKLLKENETIDSLLSEENNTRCKEKFKWNILSRVRCQLLLKTRKKFDANCVKTPPSMQGGGLSFSSVKYILFFLSIALIAAGSFFPPLFVLAVAGGFLLYISILLFCMSMSSFMLKAICIFVI